MSFKRWVPSVCAQIILLVSIFTLSLLIRSLVAIIGNSLRIKENNEREKLSPFECGFISKTNTWTPFSIHFFIRALIFLIFDVELILLFPFLILAEWQSGLMSLTAAIIFLAVLRLGFLLEWVQKYLEWSK